MYLLVYTIRATCGGTTRYHDNWDTHEGYALAKAAYDALLDS